MEDTMKQTKTIMVPNISCNHCVMTIKRELGATDGVVQVTGDPSSKMVTVTWEEPPADWKSLNSLLHEIGYPPAT
jgi:copper chaperone CopZ